MKQKMVENQEVPVDWQKRKESLKEGNKFWKPRQGQHRIVFLADPTKKVSTFEGKQIPKLCFEIEVEKARFLWDVTDSDSKNSLCGQLTLVFAEQHPAPIAGTVITLVVKGEGKSTNYTVLEALKLGGV